MQSALRPISILVVEGSSEERRWLADLLATAADMVVVGEAATAVEAQALTRKLRPTAIVLGGLPRHTGLELVAAIMETAATPIIVAFSSPVPSDDSSRAVKAGAVAVLQIPRGNGDARRRAEAELVRTVRAMSEVKVVTRRAGVAKGRLSAPRGGGRAAGAVDIIAIGASTGGPQAIVTILSGLPADLPVPVLIVQHMAVGFHGPLLDWLNRAGELHVHVAADGEPLAGGQVYLAPDERHLGVSDRRRIELSTSPPEGGLRPAVSHLFRSVRLAYGSRCIGVLLTGMGRDGADELKLMRDAGAATIAQDEASCVVYGMPKEAVAIGGATYVVGIEKVAPILQALTRRSTATRGGGERGV